MYNIGSVGFYFAAIATESQCVQGRTVLHKTAIALLTHISACVSCKLAIQAADARADRLEREITPAAKEQVEEIMFGAQPGDPEPLRPEERG